MLKRELDMLMSKVATGDNAAFEDLYRATAKGVYLFAYSFLGNRNDAEDAMQSAYLQIKQKAYTYRTGTNARAWMFQIVKNLSLDELRRRKRRTVLSSAETSEKISDRQSEGTAALEYMMRALSEDEKEIVVMHVFWGYKHREISEQLELPLGTVTWKYNEALKKLKRYEDQV